jgi:NAD(P)-dependent dehydrogenase (short-subunit alcohol dehydrogenase family)
VADWLGLNGARALVAGGAGTLGSAVAGAPLDAGASVGVIDADAEALDRMADRISSRSGLTLIKPRSRPRARCEHRPAAGSCSSHLWRDEAPTGGPGAVPVLSPRQLHHGPDPLRRRRSHDHLRGEQL